MLRTLILLCVAAAPAIAQPALTPVRMPFNERLTDRVPVSGRTLVGLVSVATGQPPTGLGLGPGRMALPSDLANGNAVCVRATTQDGRYSAENNFAVQSALPIGERAELAWPTAHPGTLKHFSLGEIAAVARRGSCAESADLIPVMLDRLPTLGVIQVLVNTRGSAVSAA